MKRPKTDEETVEGVGRLIRAVGRRAATADPDSAHWLRYLQGELDEAYLVAVAGWRDSGFSDSTIGRELGVTKQAVQQRWPRTEALS
jgi:hypothetical protein